MKAQLIYFISFLLMFTLLSCQTEREKKVQALNIKSKAILDSTFESNGNLLNKDSIYAIYFKISSDSAELRVEYVNKINEKMASLKNIEQEKTAKLNLIEQKRWDKTKAGKIQKKHPSWSNEDCERLAERRIWIGMSIDMVKYLFGRPNRANPSNYGNGTHWQWCYDDYTPSCYYGGEDGIITSYN